MTDRQIDRTEWPLPIALSNIVRSDMAVGPIFKTQPNPRLYWPNPTQLTT